MKPHQKKYYGSLFVIMFLIVATAMLLTNDGNDDVTGMAANDGTSYEDDSIIININGKDMELVSSGEGEYVIVEGVDVYTYDEKTDIVFVDRSSGIDQTYVYDSETDSYVLASRAFSKTTSTKSSTSTPSTSGTTAPPASSDSQSSLSTAEAATSANTFTVKVGDTSYQYEMVTIDGHAYARYEELNKEGKKTGDVFYYDGTGERWKLGEDKTLTDTGVTSDVLVKEGKNIAAFQEQLDKSPFLFRSDTTVNTKEEVSAETRKSQLEDFAQEKGFDLEDLIREEQATNNWIESTGGGYTYDVKTGHYEGTMNSGNKVYVVAYHGDDIGITTTVQGQKGESVETIYKDTSKIPPRYYTLGDNGQEVQYKPNEAIKSDINGAKHAVEKIEDTRQAEVERCKNENYDCQLKDDEDKEYTQNARQEAFMNRLYEEQEAKVKGLIAGWLNGWIDEKLGGWSRGVPAGICAHILGFEYYKQDGWTRVPMNASVEQLQSQLIANSRTIIIEGEKEEITEGLFRYAYTLKLLANQTLEWQTYLYNSCTGETSVDTFYDYGSLLAGGYYSLHYAGENAKNNMLFDCAQETCVYDQACVAIADGTAPTCVSLVHGAGFETPVAGNEYDCAITG